MRSVSGWNLAVLAPVVLMVAPASAATVKDGVDAWQRGDYSTAVSIWRPLADTGDGDAAFNLAQAYKLGRGVPTDLGQAKTWYGKAAQAGHVQGAANYGLLLFQDGDRKSAMPWIAKASAAGDPRAQYVYGTALFNGDVAQRDWPKAYALMTRAAAAGLPQATTSLSQMDTYMSADDRQKGLQMATQMASQPVPPTGRHIVTAGNDVAVGSASEGASDLAPVSRPPRGKVAIAQTKPNPIIDGPVQTPTLHAAVPKAKAAPTAKPVAVAASFGGKWQIQLGAYGSESGAQAAWGKLTSKLGGLSPSYQKAGAVVRLRAGPLGDRAAADRACASAKAGGAACFPVAP